MTRERHGEVPGSWVSALAEALSIPVLADPDSEVQSDIARAASQPANERRADLSRDGGVRSPVQTADR